MENKDDSSNNPSGETTKRKVKIIKKKVKKKEGEVNKEKEPESNSPVQNKEETQQEEKTPIKKTVKKIITKNKVEIEITPVKVSNPNTEITPEKSTSIQKDIKHPSSSEKNKKNEDIAKLPPKIINEIKPNPIPSQSPHIKLIYIYQRSQYNLQVKSTATIKRIKQMISSNILIPDEKITLIYNDREISEDYNNKSLSKILNFSKLKYRPIFEVKKKSRAITELDYISEIYHSSYTNKVHLSHLPFLYTPTQNESALVGLIDTFFKDLLIRHKDYTIEKDSLDGYFVCFPTGDLAFDFNRFMTMIKNTKKEYKDIRNVISIEKSNRLLKSMNKKKSKSLSRQYEIGYEYMTEEERRRKEYLIDKTKWVCNKDFITSVGKYSGIKI